MTVERIINILENTKKIEKTNSVEIDKVIEMLNDLKQKQVNYKNHLLQLLKRTKLTYEETNDITDYTKILAYTNAIEFFEDDIEKEW